MAITPSTFSLLFLFLLLLQPPITTCKTSVYFSKTTFFSDYQKMLTTFKIFIYPPPPNKHSFNFTATLTPPLSLFYNSLLTSHFITRDPNQAHLFFLPFPPQPTRSLARLIQHTRTSYPHWDRSLGADHFYLSYPRVGPTSSRNVVELKKNAVGISCFPAPAGEFTPHKDITLPAVLIPLALSEEKPLTRYLGYMRSDAAQSGAEMMIISGLRNDGEFLIESEPSDEGEYLQKLRSSKFCLFVYGEEGVVGLGEALTMGCVPVVISDRPMQDLPLMDVIKWSEIALFVGSSVGSEDLKRLLIGTCEDGGYEMMRKLGAAAVHHLVWNEGSPQPYDAFYTVIYQLWLRRHAVRYARWEPETAPA